MKKDFLPALIFFTIFTMFVLFSVPTSAKNYYVNQYDVNVKINEDGTTQFIEKINYHFEGEYNGIFLNVDYLDCGNFENYSVSEIKNGQEIIFSESNNESDGNYKLTFDDSIAKFKIFSHSVNQNQCFVIRYTLTNAVKRFLDTAQFNRKLLGENFEAPIKNFMSVISFEHPSNPQDIKIFAHGPLTGESKINDDGTISLQINDLPSNNFIEANVLFPTEYVENFSQITNQIVLENIMEQEKDLAIQSNKIREEARQKQELENKLIPISLIIFAFPILFSIVYIWLKNKMYYENHFEGDYYRELPAQYTPAEMSYLFQNIDSKDIMATLLDLTRRKFLSIEQEYKKGIIKNKNDYKITLLDNKNFSKLKPHEKLLIDWLIKNIGDGNNVYLSQITNESKKNPYKFNEKYKNWIEIAYSTSTIENNFFEHDNNKLCIALIIIFDGIMPMLLLSLSQSIRVLIPFFWFISFPIIMFLAFKKRRTKDAQIEYEKWCAFKKFLKDFSNITSSEIGSIVLWEHYLVYAVSLGVAKQVIKQLPLVFRQSELESDNLVLIPFFCSSHDNFRHFENLDSQFKKSISSAKSIAESKNSSTSGHGGGFSRGSSGGSGSRGGGGAF